MRTAAGFGVDDQEEVARLFGKIILLQLPWLIPPTGWSASSPSTTLLM